MGYLTCVESDVKQPSELLAGASRRPVTTGQCDDRRWQRQAEGRLPQAATVRVQVLLLLLLCCVVLCCCICRVYARLRWARCSGCAPGQAAAVDRGRGVHATKVRHSERKSGGRSSTTAEPGDQLGRVESRLIRLPRCCSEAGKGQTRPSLASVPSRCTEIASWASCWCNWNECLESTRHRGLPARR